MLPRQAVGNTKVGSLERVLHSHGASGSGLTWGPEQKWQPLLESALYPMPALPTDPISAHLCRPQPSSGISQVAQSEGGRFLQGRMEVVSVPLVRCDPALKPGSSV